MFENSGVAERLAVSREELSSMKLVINVWSCVVADIKKNVIFVRQGLIFCSM
jgi:hypothetical protein